jgi:hypothetical protein
MSTVYATTTELDQWMHGPDADGQTAPANAAQLLRRASRLVRRATAGALYEVDDTGLPVAAGYLSAFRDAVCCQAEAWSLNDVDPLRFGSASSAGQSLTLGPATVTNQASSEAAEAAALQSGQWLVPEAMEILREAGLISPVVSTSWLPPEVV